MDKNKIIYINGIFATEEDRRELQKRYMNDSVILVKVVKVGNIQFIETN
jgi:hypothetical protein